MDKRYLHVDILCIFFGIGTWLCVNGLWVELPLLVQHLPEGWTLPSYIAVIIQLANVGPIAYTILHSYFPKTITEKRSIYFVMALGITALLLLVQCWKQTVSINGNNHSVPMFVLVFIMAAVDCSSRVMYLPFMARFKPEYLTCFFIGEGLSSFIPSIFVLVQGTGGNPECVNATDQNGTFIVTTAVPDPVFSVELFLYLLVLVTGLSALAFYLLNYPSVVSNCLAPLSPVEGRNMLLRNRVKSNYNSTPTAVTEPIFEHCEADAPINTETDLNSTNKFKISNHFSKLEFTFWMILLLVICSLANGVFPSIQSYSCLPYGNATYHWAVTLSSMANPSVCFLMLLIKKPVKPWVGMMTVAACFVGSYILYTAVNSPFPPLRGSIEGQFLLVGSWISLVALFTYVKVSIATTMRVMGKGGLLWTGVFTQLGSSVGAITAFGVVNYTTVFKSYNPCE